MTDKQPDPKPQDEEKHPPEYREDLNPSSSGGQNVGPASAGARQTGSRIKEMYDRFPDLNKDALQQISLVAEGERLAQGATYVDLTEENPEEFTAMGDEEAGPDNLYVAKKHTPHEIWNHLTGQEKPGQEVEGSPDYETR